MISSRIKLNKCLPVSVSGSHKFYKVSGAKFFSVLNKSHYKNNKDFATNFRDSLEFNYLYNTNLMNLINSLFLITKPLERIVFMGNNPELFLEKLPKTVKTETFIYCDISEKNLIESKKRVDKLLNEKNNSLQRNINVYPVLINQEKWPFKENSINCIINNLYLHNVDNLEEHFQLINKSLMPDGCLLSNFYTTNTLNELKFIMSIAETEREGGISPNVINFPHIADMGNLLHKLRFALSTLNVYRYHYKFDDLSQIFEFLEKMGETNFLMNRRPFKRRDTYISAIALYKSMFNNKSVSDQDLGDIRTINVDLRSDRCIEDYVFATIEVGCLICWKYHSSQTPPKERGSADFDLKELATDVLESGTDEIRFGSVQLKPGSEDEYEIIEMTEKIKDKIRKKLGEEQLKEKLKNLPENKK